MHRFVLLGFLGLAVAGWLYDAGSAEAAAGKSGWVVMRKNPSSYRGLAAAAPVSGNFEGALLNPALLGSLRQPELLSVFELGFAENKYGQVAVGLPMDQTIWAAGLAYFDAGTIDLNWLETSGVRTETVTAQQDFYGFLSAGQVWSPSFRSGITLKAARSELVQRETALAVAGDLGLAWFPDEAWIFSAAVRNVGLATAYVDQVSPLPSSVYAGSGYVFKLPTWHVLVAAGANYNWTDAVLQPEAGAEFRYEIVSVNAGYQFNREEASLHFGIGLDWENIELRYAFEPGTYLESTHCISLGYRFGAPSLAVGQPAETAALPAAIPKITSVRPATAKSVETKPSPARSPAAEPLPGLARNVRLTQRLGRVTITWSPAATGKIAGYSVYLRRDKGPWRKVNTRLLAKTSYTSEKLAGGHVYAFIVKTVAPSGKENEGTAPREIRLKKKP